MCGETQPDCFSRASILGASLLMVWMPPGGAGGVFRRLLQHRGERWRGDQRSGRYERRETTKGHARSPRKSGRFQLTIWALRPAGPAPPPTKPQSRRRRRRSRRKPSVAWRSGGVRSAICGRQVDAVDQHGLGLGDGLGWVSGPWGRPWGAVHDGVAAVELEGILQRVEPLALGLVAAIGEPALRLQEGGGGRGTFPGSTSSWGTRWCSRRRGCIRKARRACCGPPATGSIPFAAWGFRCVARARWRRTGRRRGVRSGD